MNSEIVKKEVFPSVLKRIEERKDSLVNIMKFPQTGIEGWFKVETVTALANTRHAVKLVRNQGPDLMLDSGIEIELKGATDFNVTGLINEVKKHNTFLLFLQNGNKETKIQRLEKDLDVELITHEFIDDGINKWVIGLIKPK